jgi:Sec-independent protein secretion pathway component TatC
LPIVIWQLWSFFAPALEPRSQRGIRAMTAFAGEASIWLSVILEKRWHPQAAPQPA